MSATFNASDWTIDLSLADGPDTWWYRVGNASCQSASGTTAEYSGAAPPSSNLAITVYPYSGCGFPIAETTFTIPTAAMTTEVSDADWSVGIRLENGPTAGWWFRINSRSSCTFNPHREIRNIRGYGSGTHHVWAYPNNGCAQVIASSTFTIPEANLAAEIVNDTRVNLVLSDGPGQWYFKIGNGTCTQVTGTTISGISGYKPGKYHVSAHTYQNCGAVIAKTTFILP